MYCAVYNNKPFLYPKTCSQPKMKTSMCWGWFDVKPLIYTTCTNRRTHEGAAWNCVQMTWSWGSLQLCDPPSPYSGSNDTELRKLSIMWLTITMQWLNTAGLGLTACLKKSTQRLRPNNLRKHNGRRNNLCLGQTPECKRPWSQKYQTQNLHAKFFGFILLSDTPQASDSLCTWMEALTTLLPPKENPAVYYPLTAYLYIASISLFKYVITCLPIKANRYTSFPQSASYTNLPLPLHKNTCLL